MSFASLILVENVAVGTTDIKFFSAFTIYDGSKEGTILPVVPTGLSAATVPVVNLKDSQVCSTAVYAFPTEFGESLFSFALSVDSLVKFHVSGKMARIGQRELASSYGSTHSESWLVNMSSPGI